MTALSSCTRDIQTIFMQVVLFMDISIIEGHRTTERQHHHFKKGRKLRHEGIDEKVFDNSATCEPFHDPGLDGSSVHI